MPDARKQAEIDYPQAIGESGRAWLRSKPFGNEPRESARLLIDFGHVLQLLDLRAGMSLCELGCGSGWMSRFAARHGGHAEGYDISPEMLELAAGGRRARRRAGGLPRPRTLLDTDLAPRLSHLASPRPASARAAPGRSDRAARRAEVARARRGSSRARARTGRARTRAAS